MLEFDRPRPSTSPPAFSMPVDFAAYLLSSSPPAFETCFAAFKRERFSVSDGINAMGVLNRENLAPLKSIIMGGNEEENTNSNSSVFTKTENEFMSQTSTNVRKKRVKFADDFGHQLTSVRIMTESSDSPPRLRPEFLSTLAQGAQAGATGMPPLVLNFEQPASDYLVFREKVEKYFVSLENVILKDYNMAGTIKVKNIAFEKKVFVRCTFDNWENHEDTVAAYIPQGTTDSVLDTFSFEVSVPTNMAKDKTVQFAVCYEVNNRQYWDNGSGDNYEVVTKDRNCSEPGNKSFDSNFKFEYVDQFSEFSMWRRVDNSIPYY